LNMLGKREPHLYGTTKQSMAERNAGIPKERRIEFRMGLNVGDVLVDRGDMWGEGVNVAARLESLAEPGGICVSERVRDDVRGKLDVTFQDTVEQKLKNIAHPVCVFRAALRANAQGELLPKEIARASDAARPSGSPQRKLLYGGLVIGVVSSAAMMSAWFAQSPKPASGPVGVISSSAAGQSRTAGPRALPGSFALLRETASSYKGRIADARQIGREVDGHYLLAGSILAGGGRVRVNTQLIETRNGNQVWSERFDVDRASILQGEDEIVARLSRAIGLRIVELEAERRTPEGESRVVAR
jgi:hypothetical protein